MFSCEGMCLSVRRYAGAHVCVLGWGLGGPVFAFPLWLQDLVSDGMHCAGMAICRVLARKGRQVTAVADTSDLTDVLAQSAVHPGLTAVFEEV